jgi:hypothetical protein
MDGEGGNANVMHEWLFKNVRHRWEENIKMDIVIITCSGQTSNSITH